MTTCAQQLLEEAQRDLHEEFPLLFFFGFKEPTGFGVGGALERLGLTG
jgi:hypothetical protein